MPSLLDAVYSALAKRGTVLPADYDLRARVSKFFRKTLSQYRQIASFGLGVAYQNHGASR